MCTRLLKRAYFHHRWFASIFFDRKNPYQVNLLLRRQTPKDEFDLDIGFAPRVGIIPIFTSKTSFEKTKFVRVSTEEEANNIVDRLNARKECIKCGNPKNCTKEMFRKWD